MAKNKKPTKAAKKPVAKTKSAAKPKKAVSAKAKKAPAKKVVKKATPKKPVAKKTTAAKKVVAKKAEPIKKIAMAKSKGGPKTEMRTITPSVKPEPSLASKAPSPTQMTTFQMPTQRPIAHKPSKPSSNGDDRTRYSENELTEFETLINSKLAKAREEYRILKETLNRNNDEGTDATSGGNTKVLEDGAETAEKENLSQLAARQQKYIMNLENALVRIKNGTYGICSVTGKLISKERLIAVPHTTQSIEAKMMQQD
jgi:RNA polymerase-binding transcription factor DksA